MIRTRPAALSLAVLLTACAAPPPPAPSFTAQDEAAIDAVVAAALEIANSSADWTAYVQAYYAPGATVLPPNQPALQGHDAIATFMSAFPPMSDFRITKVAVEGAGDLAYVYGKYHMELGFPEGPVVDDGKFIEVWKRQSDGGWKVAFDMFSSDLPAM